MKTNKMRNEIVQVSILPHVSFGNSLINSWTQN